MRKAGLSTQEKKIINKKNEKIQKCIQSKNIKKAISLMQDILQIDPENPKLIQKMGDLYNLAGQKDEAVEYYYAVAEKYLKENYLLKAVALFKSIIRIDPSHRYDRSLKAFYKLQKLQKKMKKEQGSEVVEKDDFDYPVITRVMAEDIDEEEKIPSTPEIPELVQVGSTKNKEDLPVNVKEPLQDTLVKDSKAEFDKEKMEEIGSSVEMTDDDLIPEREIHKTQPLSIPLFKDLEPKEFEAIFHKLKLRTYPKEKVIIRQGDKGDSMFFITNGKVNITYKDNKGAFYNLAVLSENDFFGEFTLFTAKTRQANVTSITDVELLELSVSDLRDIIKKQPNLLKTLYQFYRERVLENFLTVSAIFGKCDIVGRRVLAKKFRVKKFPKNTNIFGEGEKSTFIYYIKKGKVNLLSKTPSEMEILVAEIYSDDIIGEFKMDTPEMFTAIAKEETEILMLRKEEFIEFPKRYPQLEVILEEISIKRASDRQNLLKAFSDGFSG